jgi:hypothetical protein
MSEVYPEPSTTSHRDPSDDKWWHRVLDATAAEAQLRTFEDTGQEASWSDAVMHSSAVASMGWRQGQWDNIPKGPVGDVAKGFSARLAEEYMRPEQVGHWIDAHESLPNVRAYMTRADVEKTLENAAATIVEVADRGQPGEYKRPDPEKIAQVRNAMSQGLLDGRYASSPAAGQDTSPGNADQNLGWRLGYETADAGVKAMNEILAAGNDSELARSVQHTLAAQPAPRVAAPDGRADGATDRPAGAGQGAAKQTGSGATPLTR